MHLIHYNSYSLMMGEILRLNGQKHSYVISQYTGITMLVVMSIPF